MSLPRTCAPVSTVRRAAFALPLAAGLAALVLVGLPSSVCAVDGVSVTIHWSGTNENLYGGYGSVWRHDIKNTDAVSHNKLYDGPARMAKISPDGTRVAFIKHNGMVAFMSIDGGAVTDLVQSHGEASLDWPQGDWIYYTLGGFNQPSGSKVLRRVNAVTQKDEAVVTWSSGTWFFSLSADLKRAAVRPDDTPPEPYGNIVAYDMVNGGGTLRTDRGVDRWSCGTGMDPDGVYLMDGWSGAHTGMDIRRWDNLSIQASWSHEDAKSWSGPDKGIDSGTGHNRNNWSANSQKWISVHLGWGTRGSQGANQVLYNWVDKERIVVTSNTNGSKQFDSSGGFWAGSIVTPPTSPTITKQPSIATVTEGQSATFSVTAAGSSPLSYQWQRDGSNISGANAASYTLSTTKASDGGATFRCTVTNAAGSATSNNGTLTVLPENSTENTAPVVDAGDDAGIYVGKSVLLFGAVEDDGLPDDTLDLTWSRISGPDAVTIATPHAERSTATFDQVGTYLLRLTASDGELEGTDDVTVTVTEPPSITLLSPVGGEVWAVGSVQTIRWSTLGVSDVAIELSIDGGANWDTVTESVDTLSDQWGAYSWTVPDTPSTDCLVAITAYVDGASGNTSAEPFTIGLGSGTDGGSSADGGSTGSGDGGSGRKMDPHQLAGGCSAVPSSSPWLLVLLISAFMGLRSSCRSG